MPCEGRIAVARRSTDKFSCTSSITKHCSGTGAGALLLLDEEAAVSCVKKSYTTQT